MTLTAPYAPLTTPQWSTGLASPTEPEPNQGWLEVGLTALTIAMVGPSEIRRSGSALVDRLAEVATADELVVVFGCDGPGSATGVRELIARLRELLPLHTIVAV